MEASGLIRYISDSLLQTSRSFEYLDDHFGVGVSEYRTEPPLTNVEQTINPQNITQINDCVPEISFEPFESICLQGYWKVGPLEKSTCIWLDEGCLAGCARAGSKHCPDLAGLASICARTN